MGLGWVSAVVSLVHTFRSPDIWLFCKPFSYLFGVSLSQPICCKGSAQPAARSVFPAYSLSSACNREVHISQPWHLLFVQAFCFPLSSFPFAANLLTIFMQLLSLHCAVVVVVVVVGAGVGDGVGFGVGDGVGLGVGDGVGAGVGEGVGEGVGDGVGLGVGTGVGAGVGDGVGVTLQHSYLNWIWLLLPERVRYHCVITLFAGHCTLCRSK
jgi:hypothetical protein